MYFSDRPSFHEDKLPSMNRRFNAEIEYFWPTPSCSPYSTVKYSMYCVVQYEEFQTELRTKLLEHANASVEERTIEGK